jgi:hypothetical protein
MHRMKATDSFHDMKTKIKNIQMSSFIKTVHTTLACLVASSAFALDDRFDEPQPQDEPEPKDPKFEVVERPDLVPMGIEHMFNHVDTTTKHRIYDAKVTVANLGNADSDDFVCLIGYRVTGTYDSVKYPLGSTHYSGFVNFGDMKSMAVIDESKNWAFSIPVDVHGAEIFLIVDRYWNWFDPADIGTWEDDAGKDLVGNIVELKENNNVLGGKYAYYYEYQEPDNRVSVPTGILIKPKRGN